MKLNGHAGNSGIQNHSCGSHYPVLSYRTGCYGSIRVAEFQGVRFDSQIQSVHEGHLDLLKRAEVITDDIFAARAKGTGCSNWISCVDAPDSGYVVGIVAFESKFDAAGDNYKAVYADVVDKLVYLRDRGPVVADVSIGSWIHNDCLYVDVGVVYANRSEAVDAAKDNGQTSIWDLAEDTDITI